VGVSELVEKGLAVASRKTDVERALAAYRTDRLDQLTAVMRARQGIAEATRNLEGLRDRHDTEVAGELQEQRAKLDDLVLKEEVARKMLFETLGSAANPEDLGRDQSISFSIVRREGGEPQEIPALESTALLPGDVVKIKATAPAQQPVASEAQSVGPISSAEAAAVER
jgi:hypothetical protein